ncbi:ROK family protein [Paenibacillus caui]|uniref:ROK family protein n=1 Tax=Paenibacillus caui TaxID=2873927 RepID=UPI001CA8C3FC|nr:ROK family protein [Paenibacillus caui]
MKVIGIDIGGTTVKGVVVEQEHGVISAEYRVRTDASLGREHILARVAEVLDRLIEDEKVEAIGIGTAGRVNAEEGKVVYATDNLPGWQGLRLKDWAQDKYGIPAAVDNDANAALLGEWWLGAGRGYSDVVMLTLGTGVGGANLIGGKLQHGAHWSGGEWGHVVLIPGGRPCNCGQRGCMEQYLSGSALAALASEACGTAYASGQEVMAHYIEGNKTVSEVLNRYLDHLAVALHNIQNSLDPEAIILGGGLADSKSIDWSGLQQRLSLNNKHISLKLAELGNKAGAIGAAKLAVQLAGRTA